MSDLMSQLLGHRLADSAGRQAMIDGLGLIVLVVVVFLLVENPFLRYGLPAAWLVIAAVRVGIVARRQRERRQRR